jgi:hypothetical protein
MKHNVTSITPWAEPWRFTDDEKALTLTLTVEVRLDFLEDAQRGQFDRVGEQVAAKLHDLYWQYQLEAKCG